MLRQSNHKDRELHKVKINSGLTAKKLKITLEDLNFFEVLPILLFASFRFFSATALALRIFFSSSESKARSTVSYSWTTSQPSLFLSAPLINFWRFLMITFASATSLWISAGLLALSSVFPTANSPRTAFSCLYTKCPWLFYRISHFFHTASLSLPIKTFRLTDHA